MSETSTTKVNPEAYNVRIPLDSRRLRITKCEKKNSSKGNIMLNYTAEIFGAQPVKNDAGEAIDINGLEVYGRQMLMRGGTVKFCNQMRNSLGLPPVNDDSIEAVQAEEYLGREGVATSRSNVEETKNPVTGEVIINLHTGKPVTKIVREIVEWLGRD
jgi:hypothetical protein